MKKISRYFLIGLGIVVFFVLAPLLILYVSGTALNINSRDTDSTGILDVKSEPSGSTVYVDDKKEGDTPTTVRFLKQGEYLVKIVRDGYYDWSKRLPIEAGQVNFAQSGVDQVQLIKRSQPQTLIPEGVSSFVLVGNDIWFTRGNSIVHAPINEPTKQITIPLGFEPKSAHLLRDENHLFLSGDTIHAIVDIPKETAWQIDFSFDPSEAVVIDNIIIVNIGTTLQTYNLLTTEKNILRNDILGFTMLSDTAYMADSSGTISTSIWDGSNFKDTQPLVTEQSIPNGKTQLMITDTKELFLKNNSKTLFRVNQKLEPIANQVETVTLDNQTNELTIHTFSELLFYNFLSNKPQLLTRSSQPVNSLLIRSNIGYGFVASQSGLEIIEIDNRDSQNRYKILEGSPVWQIAITENQKTIIALQDGSLVMIEIRD